ncbi:MAG: hypothetical protein MZV64_67180 [Ignavibacteriales bacterium]|nr:hypothetical protein [Ignavibacteriales bacterium]
MTDAETNEERWIDTSSTRVQEALRKEDRKFRSKENHYLLQADLDSVYVQAGANYIHSVDKFFQNT